MIPSAIVIASAIALTAFDGGSSPHVWYPVAVLLVLALVADMVCRPDRVRLNRPVGLALTAYAGFCAWSYATIAWAEAPGDAFDGANRALLYGLALAMVLRGARSANRIAALLWLTCLAVSAIAAGLLVMTARDDPSRLFFFGRLSEPTGYANATASFLLIAVWPALHIAAAKATPRLARGLALACACLLLEVAVLTQSRGAVLGFAVVSVAYLALVPRRAAATAALAAVGLAVAASWDSLVAVAAATDAAALDAALASARYAVVITCLVALMAGSVAAIGAKRLPTAWLATRQTAVVGRGFVLALPLAVVLAAGVAASSGLGGWVGDRWREFRTSGYEQVGAEGTRLDGSLGSNRYDFYRVGIDEFGKHPLGGIGADNFVVAYLRDRRTHEAPRNPHSLAVQLVSQVGVVGTGLFLLFLVATGLAIARLLRSCDPGTGGLCISAAAGFAMWITHGLVDYLWNFAALGVSAAALLGLALALVPVLPSGSSERGETHAVGRGASHVLRAALVSVGLLAAGTLALAGVGAAFTAAGYSAAQRSPGLALERFAQGARYSRLSAEPLLAGGVVARAVDDQPAAANALRAALSREPSNWLTNLELALLESELGHQGRTTTYLEATARLNPRLEGIDRLVERARGGKRIDIEAVDEQLRQYPAHRDALVLERLYRRGAIGSRYAVSPGA